MTQSLVIVGAGGFARETAAAVHAVNQVHPVWDLLGFLDDNPALHGTERGGLPVLGGIEALADLRHVAVIVCVGNPNDYAVRQRVVRRLGLPAERFATVVHPSVQLGARCLVGAGSVLLAHVTLTADVTVGSHVAIMPQAVLTHDDDVHDFATIASGVRLGGGSTVARGAYLGAGALVRESLTVGAGSLLGMGSVLLRDVPPGQVWAGNPARFLRVALPTEPRAGVVQRSQQP